MLGSTAEPVIDLHGDFLMVKMTVIMKLTIPLGPNVVLTKSAMAIAPTKEACQVQQAVTSRILNHIEIRTSLKLCIYLSCCDQ